MKKRIINIFLIISSAILLYFIGYFFHTISILVKLQGSTLKWLIQNIFNVLATSFILFSNVYTFILINKQNISLSREEIQKARRESKRLKLEKLKDKIENQLESLNENDIV